ncbi:lipid-A-disaccharide synthase [Desulfocurvus vexinensis]|uniref:lipid-A-disaccharide synthase n=1 Tax=Desulfocurvus vexinensis TaxID=399548 RepID=UPI0004B65040|nr:lipid-A-disaccharide synthase [Desulfocurvus vexinensis]
MQATGTMSQGAGPVWVSAGEVSGDLHGALLVRAMAGLAPGLRFTGMGGPAMAGAGVQAAFDIAELSLVGLTEVLAHLPRIAGLLRRMRRRMAEERPAAVVCIDAPDFNFFVVRMARRLGIPVFYYICPQVWAWRAGRVNFLKKYVQRVLCILPFEKAFLAERGLDADYVGHPLTDQIPLDALRALAPEPGRVGILPGSRTREIETLLPEFGAAARTIAVRIPGAAFSILRAPGVDEARLRALWPADLPVEIVPPEERYPAMRRAQVLLAASGTATLEAALIGTPAVVAYRVSALSYALGRLVVGVPNISLPNLILGERALPELLQGQANGPAIAVEALRWLTDPAAMAEVRARLARLAGMVGEPGAPGRAARIILDGAGLGPRPAR